jgi:hypothetical protein
MSDMRQEWRLLVCSECGEMDTDEPVCGFCDSAEGVTMIDVVPADVAEQAVAAVVERVVADDEAMSRARRAYLNSPPYGSKHGEVARLDHMRAAIRAAFEEAKA